MNKHIEKRALSKAPVYGDYERTGSLNVDGGRWVENVLRVFFYKLGFIVTVEGLSKSGFALFLWPILNGMIIHFLVQYLNVGEEKIAEHYPLWLVVAIEGFILFWWMNKSTAKKILLDFIGPGWKALCENWRK